MARAILIAAALGFLGLFVALPLAMVMGQALDKGFHVFWSAITEPDAVASVRLTLLAAAIAVPLNVAFGVAASWAIARFRFPGRGTLAALIDLPLAVSPVIAGLVWVLIFGGHGWLGPWLNANGLNVIFGVPGIVIATVFVTFPFVARELIPLMQAQGSDEEEAALALGASGRQIFWRVTLPNIRWSLLYGVVLCGARAMGEFGAVSVVSGHIRGETNTMPLHIEILYNEYAFAAAFAVASMLTLTAVAALAAKRLLEGRIRRETAEAAALREI